MTGQADDRVRSLDAMSAPEVIATLGLEYLDGEGVWFRLLWRTDHGNAIYGLLTPEDFSALHVLREDEAWVHVAGAPARMLLLHPGGAHESPVLGTDVGAGHVPVLRVPAGTWQGSRTCGAWTLVACTLAPPFSGFTLAGADTDLSEWDAAADAIAELVRG